MLKEDRELFMSVKKGVLSSERIGHYEQGIDYICK